MKLKFINYITVLSSLAVGWVSCKLIGGNPACSGLPVNYSIEQKDRSFLVKRNSLNFLKISEYDNGQVSCNVISGEDRILYVNIDGKQKNKIVNIIFEIPTKSQPGQTTLVNWSDPDYSGDEDAGDLKILPKGGK